MWIHPPASAFIPGPPTSWARGPGRRMQNVLPGTCTRAAAASELLVLDWPGSSRAPPGGPGALPQGLGAQTSPALAGPAGNASDGRRAGGQTWDKTHSPERGCDAGRPPEAIRRPPTDTTSTGPAWWHAARGGRPAGGTAPSFCVKATPNHDTPRAGTPLPPPDPSRSRKALGSMWIGPTVPAPSLPRAGTAQGIGGVDSFPGPPQMALASPSSPGGVGPERPELVETFRILPST